MTTYYFLNLLLIFIYDWLRLALLFKKAEG
jgi:hypothetical protein